MLVYHGSCHNFRVLRIRKDLARRSTADNEGYGIYFSLDKSVAQSYGNYLYTLDVSDRYLIDMRVGKNCLSYIGRLNQDVWNAFNFGLGRYIDLHSLASYLHNGGIAVSRVTREVELLLDSNELFYAEHCRDAERVYSWLKHWSGVPKAYLFQYHIKDCGIIRDLSPEVVRIVSKERV